MTHGGLPEVDALHWDGSTYHKIGVIVYLLMSGNSKKAAEGYREFHALKRMFMAEEFDRMISSLDDFRREKNMVTLSAMVEAVGNKIVESGEVKSIDQQPEDLPAWKPEPVVCAPVAIKKEKVEQMDLFTTMVT
ncbi:MAG: hypothetical protein WC449_06075 [Candidatus Paceibacterota bacterium]